MNGDKPIIVPAGVKLDVGPDGVATLKPGLIQEPEIVTERKRQEKLARDRMHRQVALEIYTAEACPPLEMDKKKVMMDEAIELAGYLIDKTGGHQ